MEKLKNKKLKLKVKILKRLVEDDKFFESWKDLRIIVGKDRRHRFSTWNFLYQMEQKAEQLRELHKNVSES